VLDRNYRTREGEIDLIAIAGATLVFCEVKTLVSRSLFTRGPVSPLEGVRPAKRRQVRRIARAWLADRREAGASPRYREVRFDAIGVALSSSGRLLALEPADDLKRRYGSETLEEAFFSATGRSFEEEDPEDADREVFG